LPPKAPYGRCRSRRRLVRACLRDQQNAHLEGSIWVETALQAVHVLYCFNRLCVAHTSAHSAHTFSTPRSWNRQKPCACLICPKTCSTMVLRHRSLAPLRSSAYVSPRRPALPTLECARADPVVGADCVSAFLSRHIGRPSSSPQREDSPPNCSRCRPTPSALSGQIAV
jgi:hypothetical protein